MTYSEFVKKFEEFALKDDKSSFKEYFGDTNPLYLLRWYIENQDVFWNRYNRSCVAAPNECFNRDIQLANAFNLVCLECAKSITPKFKRGDIVSYKDKKTEKTCVYEVKGTLLDELVYSVRNIELNSDESIDRTMLDMYGKKVGVACE